MRTKAAESSVLGPTLTGLTERGRGKSTESSEKFISVLNQEPTMNMVAGP